VLGLALMTLDHINKHLLHERVTALFDLGRMALPLFGLVLAYNLARPGTLERGVYIRVLDACQSWRLSRKFLSSASAGWPGDGIRSISW